MKDCLSLIRAFFLSVSIKPSRVVVYQQKNDRQCKALFKVYYFLFAIVSVILCFAPATSSYSALKFSPQFGVVDVMARFTYVRFLFFVFSFYSPFIAISTPVLTQYASARNRSCAEELWNRDCFHWFPLLPTGLKVSGIKT